MSWIAFYADFIREEMKAYEAEYDAECDGEKISIVLLVQRIREQIQDYGCEIGEHVSSIKVDYHPEFKSTKCFYCLHGKEKQLFSYLLAINGRVSDSQRFSKACRNLVAERLREFKKQ